ncbi:MAG TPA: phosphoheptose isomerase [Pseudonocardia sp.]|jgi:D-sedoheptulose 7-phosphate isomerase
MAARFHRGGRLVVFGAGPDAAHVVVEFVHPVIVGKPALPAFSLAGPALAEQLELSAGPDDIALAITAGGDDHPGPGGDQRLTEAMDTAGRLGMLRVALLGAACGWRLEPGRVEHLITVRSADPLVVREVQVSCYHLLWELVHVFLERPGALS